jgi:CBS domain-containing protein
LSTFEHFDTVRDRDMTTKKIMTSHVITLRPDDKVADALALMHKHHVRNLPVVDDNGAFIGLFGVRRLSRLLLPQAAVDLSRYSVADLSFLPDEIVQMSERWREVAKEPVERFLEKEKKLLFCKPDTSFPQLLELLEQSKDSSLPVIIVEGSARKLVGMVSAWDVLEGIVMKLLVEEAGTDTTSTQDK